ncbi:hypothetical protein [Acetobacter senegalensis]|uniref:hypothetical protein n=1 Tax=Acetobacter senegalensis TaxID=446692 RepID=UPI000A5F5DFC|nr:hypothetical protein [Acetobacter senegalensis]
MTADYRFDPLQFPMPAGTGLFPRRDIDLYAELSSRVGVGVHGFILVDLGRKAWNLRKKTGNQGRAHGRPFVRLCTSAIRIYQWKKSLSRTVMSLTRFTNWQCTDV